MNGNKAGRTEQLAALGVTLVVASALVGFLAIGCGKQEGGAVATQAVKTEQGTPGPAVAASAPALAQPLANEATPAADTTEQAEKLPPDIAGSAAEEFVQPGDVVEITAEGTTDVVEVTLTDARGKTQPLTYDASMGMWKTLYRVPLKTSTDRLGISLTAKNGEKGWRRVWVFLNVQKLAAEADSTAK